mgnify:CR=1 FL=1
MADKRQKLDHTILAKGEVTGHAHRASGGAVLYQNEHGSMEMEQEGDVVVTHEEHHTQTIPPSPTGSYRIDGVVEYDPFLDAASRVAD